MATPKDQGKKVLILRQYLEIAFYSRPTPPPPPLPSVAPAEFKIVFTDLKGGIGGELLEGQKLTFATILEKGVSQSWEDNLKTSN